MAKFLKVFGSPVIKTAVFAAFAAGMTAAAPVISGALPGYLQPIVAALVASLALHLTPPSKGSV